MENLLALMFTEENGLPYPNLDIRNSMTIRAIILRDNKTDKEGKLLLYKARKELAYIYFMADKRQFSGFQRKQKHEKIRAKVGLPDTWEPDELVLQCLEEVTEDVVTKQDKLLNSAEELAEDFLDIYDSIKKNNKRLKNFFNETITQESVTEEQLRIRTEQIKSVEETILKYAKIFDSIITVIKTIDEAKAERIREEKKQNRHKLSSTETNKKLYERKADRD